MTRRGARLAAFVIGASLSWVFGLELPLRAATPAVVVPAPGGAAWTDAERASLRADLDALLGGAQAVRGAHLGLLVVDARDGSTLYERLAGDEFMPASTLKLVVGNAALARLGTNFRFHTEAFATGPLSGGTVHGDLVLRGGGDAMFAAADTTNVVRALHLAGITNIEGGAWVDSSVFDTSPYPPGWVWDDLVYDYAAPVSGTPFEHNAVHLTVGAGDQVGARAVVRSALFGRIPLAPMAGCPVTSGVEILPKATTGAAGTESSIDILRDGICIAVTGSVPLGGSDTVDAAVPGADDYAYEGLTHALHAGGIAYREVARPTAPPGSRHTYAGPNPNDRPVTLWRHDSEPLPRLLTDMWLSSDNLLAECLLKSLAVARSGAPGTTDNGVAAEMEYLRSLGIDPKTVTLRDGSGLSIYDRITPRDLVTILQADWNGSNRGLVLDALPVAGVRGTLADSFAGTPAAGRVFAKTGSMTHVRSLAGFAATQTHGTLTFALMVDDYNGDVAALNVLRAALVSRLAGT